MFECKFFDVEGDKLGAPAGKDDVEEQIDEVEGGGLGPDVARIFDVLARDRRRGIALSKVVCTFRPEKSNPNRTRFTIAGQNIKYPGNVRTKTASLDLIKLLLNSVLSRRGAKFVTFDIKKFYLQTHMDRREYIRIKLSDIPTEFINEYSLMDYVHANGWV